MSAVRHSVVVMRRARELRDAGWAIPRIREILAKEHAVRPSNDTIARWLDPAVAERRAQAAREKRAEVATFGWSGWHPSPSWKLGRMRALRAAGVSYAAIAKVMLVDFGDELTEEEVRYAVKRGRPPRKLLAKGTA